MSIGIETDPATESQKFREYFAGELEQHWGALRGFFIQRKCPIQDVEDLIQQTFLGAWQNRHTYVVTLPFTPWLKAIAHNKFVDYRRSMARKAKRRITGSHSYEGEEVDIEDYRGRMPVDIAISREICGQLAIMFEEFDDEGALSARLQRGWEALKRQIRNGETRQDIADAVKSTEDRVRDDLHNFRSFLRRKKIGPLLKEFNS